MNNCEKCGHVVCIRPDKHYVCFFCKFDTEDRPPEPPKEKEKPCVKYRCPDCRDPVDPPENKDCLHLHCKPCKKWYKIAECVSYEL